MQRNRKEEKLTKMIQPVQNKEDLPCPCNPEFEEEELMAEENILVERRNSTGDQLEQTYKALALEDKKHRIH